MSDNTLAQNVSDKDLGLDSWTDAADLRRVLAESDPEACEAIEAERRRQFAGIELIASENYVSPAVLAARAACSPTSTPKATRASAIMAAVTPSTLPSASPLPAPRSCSALIMRNVQPTPGPRPTRRSTRLARRATLCWRLQLDHGGHLSHGSHLNSSGKLYNFIHYSVDRRPNASTTTPCSSWRRNTSLLIVAAASAYPRFFDFSGCGHRRQRRRPDDGHGACTPA